MATTRSIEDRGYIPLLKSKVGERMALRQLAPRVRNAITPGFHLRPRRTEAQIAAEVTQIAAGWTESPVLLDTAGVDSTNLPAHPLLVANRVAAKVKLGLIPVVSDVSSENDLKAARTVMGGHGFGVGIRLSPAAWLSAQSVLDPILSALGSAPGEIDLILDAGVIANDATLELAKKLLAGNMASVPVLPSWRRVAIAGGSFPVDLGGLPAKKPIRLPRREAQLWDAKPSVGRRLTYADYGVAHPETPDEFENARAIPLWTSVRYTTPDAFLVAKGGDANKEGPAAMHAVCGIVAGEKEFRGAAYSWADQWIADRAAGTGQAGNYSTWRKVGTVHHVTLMVDLLSS